MAQLKPLLKRRNFLIALVVALVLSTLVTVTVGLSGNSLSTYASEFAAKLPEPVAAVLGQFAQQQPVMTKHQPKKSEEVANTAVLKVNPAEVASLTKELQKQGTKVKYHNKKLNFITVEYSGDFAAQFPDLKHTPDYYMEVAAGDLPNDPRFNEQWGLTAIEVDKIWAQPDLTDTTARKVAVIDSGICEKHPDLQGRIVAGWDFVQNDNAPQDEFGHGCAVAGVIAANVNNTVGIAGLTKNVKVMPLRVLDGNGVGTYSQLAAAIVHAVDNGAQVINLSLGGSEDSPLLKSAVDYAASKGVKLVAAAGNTSSSQVLYPAKYERVVAVGAVSQKNAAGQYPVAGFSSTGSEIDVWAPGQDILTLSNDGGYKAVNGTSFAAPMVSGQVAISVEAKNLQYKSNTASSSSLSSGEVTAQAGFYPPVDTRNLKIEPGFDYANEVFEWESCVDGMPNGDETYHGYHMGLDIIHQNDVNVCSTGALGSHVYSVSDGKIIKVRGSTSEKSQGQMVVIEHSNTTYGKFYSVYMHITAESYILNNQGKYISEIQGSRNANGQLLLGAIGDYSNNPHLHFDIRKTEPGDVKWGGYSDSLTSHPYINPCNFFDCSPLRNQTDGDENQICTQTPNNAGVALYKQIECRSNVANFYDVIPVNEHLKWVNLRDDIIYKSRDFEDKIFSIAVKPGWSVRVYQHYLNYGDEGQSRCITHNMWNLSSDKFDTDTNGNPITGISIGGQISSFKVYGNSNCSDQQLAYCPAPVATGTGLTAQSCEVTPTPIPSSFCSNIPWGGAGTYCSGDQLVTCSSTKTITNTVQCRYGCQTNPLFTPDVCKTGEGEPNLSTESVKFYGDSNFGETSLRLSLGTGKSDEPNAGTIYKSIKIPAGWSVKAYTAAGQQGDQACWNTEQPLLETLGWQNKIESVEVSNSDICPVNTPEPPYWQANYYSGDSKWWDRDIPASTATCKDRITGETLVKDFGANGPCGGGHGPDNWVGEYIATRNFEDGNYVLHINHDDGVQVFVNGKQKVIRSSMGNGPICAPFRLSGNVEFRILHREESGDAKIDFTWSDDTSVCNDITPPKGTMVLPEKNIHTNSSSPILVKAIASDPTDTGQTTSGVSKVEFYAKSNNWNNNQLTLIGSATTNPYEFNWNTSSVPDGIYFITAKVFDTQGNDSGFLGNEAFWTYITVDRTKPSADVLPINTVGAGFQFNVSWAGIDNLSLISELNYDVQYQLNCTGNWIDWIGFRSGTSKTFLGKPGTNYCFRVRAIDVASNVGNWSNPTAPVILAACDVNQFTAEYFDNKDLSGEALLTTCENAIDHDWGAGGPALNGENVIYGDGGDGALTITTNTTDNPVDAVASGQVGTNQLKANNANFRTGQKIFVYQVKGVNAGNYQITTIKAYDSATGTITTSTPLKVTYASGGGSAAQVIVVKQYSDVTINTGVTFKAKEWNGQTGGLLLFLANGKVQIDGTLDVTGTGFRGGRSGANPNPYADNTMGEQGEGAGGAVSRSVSRNANGAGGGAPRDFNGEGNGGGGGGNGGDGSTGQRHISNSGAVGEGGAAIGGKELTQLFFGGGGGGGGFGDSERLPFEEFGNGGDGGGAVYIRGKQFILNGQISARGYKGQVGMHDIGAGGSGAGGSVYIRGDIVNFGVEKINVHGISEAPGGTSGQGGQSAQGRIRVEYLSSVAGSATWSSVEPVTINTSDNFSVRWTGKFNFAPNRYKFKATADDGMRVWVDGNQIINDWVDGHTETMVDAYVGSLLDLKVEYYENGGNAWAKLNIIPGSNKPPVINPIPEQITTVGKPFANINLGEYAYDPDFNYTIWSGTNSPHIQISVANDIATITKADGWVGSEFVSLTLTDEWGESTSTQIKFTVLANTPPQFGTIPEQITTEDNAFAALNLQSYVQDPDQGDTHSFTVTGNTNLTITIAEGVASVTPKPNWSGSETLSFTVTDRNGDKSTTSAKFTVTPINDAPVINSQPDTEALEDAAYVYQVQATDVDNPTLTYTLITGPAGLQLSTTGKFTWTPRQADVGVHPIKLTVTDGEFTLDQAYELTVINVNDAPVITSSPTTQTVDGSVYTYDVNATDEDGDSLTYSLTQKPAGMVIDSTTGRISWQTDQADIGEHTITVKVSDGQASDTQTYKLKVIAKYTVGSSLITRERGGVENKEVNPSETINFIIKVANNTTTNVKLLKFNITTVSPYVKITDKNETIHDVAGGTTEQTQGEFSFSVDKDTPIGTVIVFKVTMENNQTKEVYVQEVKFTVK